MLPIVEVPKSIEAGMLSYRDVFCRDEGFDHVSLYVTGLIISPNKTLQGIYDLQVWEEVSAKPSRRSMHESVFESGWDSEALMKQHRSRSLNYTSVWTWIWIMWRDRRGDHGLNWPTIACRFIDVAVSSIFGLSD